MTNVRQTNFAAGELDPLLHGRTDLPIFGRGLKTCRNFFITKSGAAMSRPGTRFVRQTATNVAGSFDLELVRLIPFVAGDGASYVLEVGNFYMRFHTLGRTVESSPGTPYSVATPWSHDELDSLRYAQVADVLTIVSPTRIPGAWELRYSGSTNWTLAEVTYQPPGAVWPDIAASEAIDPFNPAAPKDYTTSPFMLVGTPPFNVATAAKPAREWRYGATAILQDQATGVVLESLMTEVRFSTNGTEDLTTFNPNQVLLTNNSVVVYTDLAVTLKRLATDNTAPVTTYKVIAFNLYKGRGDLFGWIGTTRGREFVDNGIEPDYGVQPPLGINPFRIQVDPTWALGASNGYEMPCAVAFFQERRCFGRNGGAVWAVSPTSGRTFLDSARFQRVPRLHLSMIGDYFNFDTRLAEHISGEALELLPASRKRESLKHLVEAHRLVVLTDSTARALGGKQGPLDFDDIDFPVVDEVGSSDVRPLVIDGSVFFIRTKGAGARALVPQATDQPYAGADLSVNAQHLVRGKSRTIVDWCYQEDPFSIVWAVRADGVLLSLTFDREAGQVAWARHDTDGLVERVCSVPEGEEDAVYLVINREVPVVDEFTGALTGAARARYIERFTSRVRRVLEEDADPTYKSSPAATDTDSLYPTDVCSDCTFTYAGAAPANNTISDPKLLALLNKQVYITGRNTPVLGPYKVLQNGVNGEVTFDADFTPEMNALTSAGVPIWVAHVGLAFTADLETLSVRGDATLRQKTVIEVGFELDQAKGVKNGQDFNNLSDWEQREVSDSYDSPSAANVLLVSPVENAWDKHARAVLRQSLPLPVTVVGISREVDVGER